MDPHLRVSATFFSKNPPPTRSPPFVHAFLRTALAAALIGPLTLPALIHSVLFPLEVPVPRHSKPLPPPSRFEALCPLPFCQRFRVAG